MTPSLAALQERLPALMPLDQRKLGRRIDRAAALRDAAARQRALAGVETGLAAALARVEARSQSVPAITYPAELPVSQRKDEIAAAIRDHQVVIVAGETGSGKTTQLPKICLELGRGIAGQIGHTQPRRIAARTVADRIAAELGTELGGVVGYKVRFAGTSSDDTLVKVMTDGILLTELQRDRELLRYDTLIIDEAHERSLNIDFILGYLKRLLPSRPDLKVIITSATIDPQRFSTQFWGAPVIEVSGRTYPVEVRYRPLADPDHPDREPRDQVQGISDAVAELTAEGPGDILVFLSGEREIRDTAEALAGRREPGRPAAVRPAAGRRAAPDLRPAPGPARGAGHQHRGDLADRPRRQVRDRRGHRPDLPVRSAGQGPAAADRANFAGLGRPAQGPVRADRRRHLHPALQRGGLRLAPAIHRPGDPADQPGRGHLADGGAGPGGDRRLPVHRPAAIAQRHRRRPAARRTRCAHAGPGSVPAHRCGAEAGPAPAGPAAGPDDPGGRPAGLRQRGADHHGGAVHPGSPGAPRGGPRGGRRHARPVRRAGVRLPRPAHPLGLPAGPAARAVRVRVPAPVPPRVLALPAGTRMAGRTRPAPPGGPRHRRRRRAGAGGASAGGGAAPAEKEEGT